MAEEQLNIKRRPEDGRPEIPFDWKQLDALLRIQATLQEIEGVMQVSMATVERRCESERQMTFAEYSRDRRGEGKASLRRTQWSKALGRQTVYDKENRVIQHEAEPSERMLIHLGKHELNQTDSIQMTGKDGVPLFGGQRVSDEERFAIIMAKLGMELAMPTNGQQQITGGNGETHE